MGSENHLPHAIIFPFMAQGHTIPLLDFAKVLSHRGLKVTIITTPSNAKQIMSSINPIKFSNISTHVIQFPMHDDLPQGCENTKDLISQDQLLYFLRSTLKFKEPFECFLREMVEKKPCHSNIFVVCDFFLGWTMPICSSLNIPGILFFGMGVLSSALWRLTFTSEECIKRLANGEELEDLQGMRSPFPLAREDFSDLFTNHPTFQFLYENGDQGSPSCWGVLCNSFEELEGEYVSAYESSYNEGVKVWCVGPLFLYDQGENDMSLDYENLVKVSNNGDHKKEETNKKTCNLYLKWLDEQLECAEGVIYVSFGTQAHMLSIQMDEIALGLEMAGYHFIWAVGSKNWTPPEGWEERVKGKGLIVREWVDQRSILSHPSIRGFLSHCGWNSVLESLAMGVPMLSWPVAADQPQNAKFVAKVLKAGLVINENKNAEKGAIGATESVVIGRYDISSRVKELMGGERGKLARERAKEIGKMSRIAVSKDGSSPKKLDQLIESLIEWNKNM